MQEPEDIVARVTTEQGRGSLVSLTSYIARACGHVNVDAQTLDRGYRFYPAMSDEIPEFFNRRFTTGTTNLAITLQGGMSASGDDPFAECTSTKQARSVIEDSKYEPTSWTVVITVGTRAYEVTDVASSQFIAHHPDEFRALAEELIALGALDGTGCAVCGLDADQQQSHAA